MAILIGASAPCAARGESWRKAAERLVREAVAGGGVKDPRVLDAIRNTPRHEFMPREKRRLAYYDMALPIGEGQTISPPFIVAYMTEQLEPQPTDRVLEIGTGSGYQAAVLSPLVAEVYTIEIVPSLGRRAAATLKRLGYSNVHVKIGDGFQGWPEYAPFDKIIVTCSPEAVPKRLVEQLKEGGRMIIPVGQRYQQTLYLMTKRDGKLVQEALRPTLFVPMTGAAEASRRQKPDPLRPEIVNGGFEQLDGDPPLASAWHYQRQMALVVDAHAPEGQRFARFRNDEPGRWSQALQGFAIDGRRVGALDFSLWARALRVMPPSKEGAARLMVTFYDARRTEVGGGWLGPWRGSFEWKQVRKQIRVPIDAREVIIAVGLLGATGRLDIDDVQVRPVLRDRMISEATGSEPRGDELPNASALPFSR